MKEYIDAAAFKEMLLCAAAALDANSGIINELNVFPVPDGDTGTNMSLTMDNAVKELKKREFGSISDVADCAASALLRGARGNSGVILSLLFRGMAKQFKGIDVAGTVEFAAGMNEGVDAAYKAVMKPAEGTILTVSRVASKAAMDAARLGSDLEGLFICAVKAGREALAETQEINPVLKKAGVVDAGGKGYTIILETMIASLKGEVCSADYEKAADETAEKAENVFGVFSTEEITFTFDTVFIVRKKSGSTDISRFRRYLDSIGDSLVISEGDGEFKVHVHTDIPGSALNEAQKYGTLELAKIENMRSQHDDVAAGRKAASADDLESADAEPEIAAPEKRYGAVAVCAGEGLENLFRELGCDEVVTGGQTMNPSTDDILKAVNRTPAETVFVLPNNKNIIMAAEQCIPLTEKHIAVLPTRTVPQGISAMLNFNPEDEEQNMIETMNEAAGNVHTAMVTYAARDSEFDGNSIHSGEYLALLDGALLGSYSALEPLLEGLGKALAALDPGIITVYSGEDASEDEAEKVSAALEKSFPDADVSLVPGGQPVYYYMISIE